MQNKQFNFALLSVEWGLRNEVFIKFAQLISAIVENYMKEYLINHDCLNMLVQKNVFIFIFFCKYRKITNIICKYCKINNKINNIICKNKYSFIICKNKYSFYNSTCSENLANISICKNYKRTTFYQSSRSKRAPPTFFTSKFSIKTNHGIIVHRRMKFFEWMHLWFR